MSYRENLVAYLAEMVRHFVMFPGLGSNDVFNILIDYMYPGFLGAMDAKNIYFKNMLPEVRINTNKKLHRLYRILCAKPTEKITIEELSVFPTIYDNFQIEAQKQILQEMEQILPSLKSFDGYEEGQRKGRTIQEVLLICAIYNSTCGPSLKTLNRPMEVKDEKRVKNWWRSIRESLLDQMLHNSTAISMYDYLYEKIAAALRVDQELFLRSYVLTQHYQERKDVFRAAATLNKKETLSNDMIFTDSDKASTYLVNACSLSALQTICEVIIPLSEAIFREVIPNTLTEADFKGGTHEMLHYLQESPILPKEQKQYYMKQGNKREDYQIDWECYQEALWLSNTIRTFILTAIEKGTCVLFQGFEESAIVKDKDIYEYLNSIQESP